MTQTARSQSRSAARLAAVQALYQLDMEQKTPLRVLLHEFHQHRLGATIEDVEYADAEIDFFDDVVAGVDARREEIDGLIADKLAEGWSLARLDKPMRQILRAGTYELLARADVPTASIITEYVDVAHAFYDKRETGFVNGLLDAVAKAVRGLAGCAFKLSRESEFLAQLRRLPLHPGARGLNDDAAVIGDLVLTHDMIAEGVHFLPDDPPGDVAWKLLAVNLSDLAAKGAMPIGVLLGYPLTGDAAWDAAFVAGLGDALVALDVALLGGDTIALPAVTPRVLGLTAIGRATVAPARSGARAGDGLYVTGTIGAAGLGLALLRAGKSEPAGPIAAYRRPRPLIAEGRALAPHVTAMMDVSDGLLIDAARMAQASDLAVAIDLDAVPLCAGATLIEAITAGDDYQLLFAAAAPPPVAATRIGTFAPGNGLTLSAGGVPVPLPEQLGYQHG